VAFFLFLGYLVLSFLRPGERYPQLASFQLMDVATVLSGLAATAALLLGRGPTFRVPQPLLVLAFAGWAMFSVVVAERWPGGALLALVSLAPSLAVFFLLYLNLDSLARVRRTCAVLSFLGLIVAVESVVSYYTGWRADLFIYRQQGDDPDALEAGFEDEGLAGLEDIEYISRIRNLGFLQDPNDLAQALVCILPMLGALRRPHHPLRNALLVWLPGAGFLLAIALTRSRGSIPALAMLLFLAFRRRVGRTLSLILGTLGGGAAVFFGFTRGRALTIDQSAEGRLDAWAEGLQMLKSSPVWGVGYSAFGDHHPLVAHNSFVHCFAETGLIGYFLWLGLLALTLDGLRRVQRIAPETDEGGEALRWAHAVQFSLITFLVGAFFLSRSYGVMLFLLLGLGTAVIDVAGREEWGDPGPPFVAWVPAVGLLSIASVIGFWILLRLLR
jgi:putative inorganic carbon (hco3(-)) transporter